MTAFPPLRVVVRKPFEREGRLLRVGEVVSVPADEATSLINVGLADPEGSVRVPERPKNWVRSWRN